MDFVWMAYVNGPLPLFPDSLVDRGAECVPVPEGHSGGGEVHPTHSDTED